MQEDDKDREEENCEKATQIKTRQTRTEKAGDETEGVRRGKGEGEQGGGKSGKEEGGG